LASPSAGRVSTSHARDRAHRLPEKAAQTGCVFGLEKMGREYQQAIWQFTICHRLAWFEMTGLVSIFLQ
jgi:hypothetical protein